MHSEEFIARRLALGLSQIQVADLISVKQASVSDWERDKRPIPDGVDEDLSELEALQDAIIEHNVSETLENGTGLPVQIMLPMPMPGKLPYSFQQVCMANVLRDLRSEGVHATIVRK